MPAASLRSPRPAWVLTLVAAGAVASLMAVGGPLSLAVRDGLYLGALVSGVAVAGRVYGRVAAPGRARAGGRPRVGGRARVGWWLVLGGLAALVLGEVLWIALTRSGVDAWLSVADLAYMTGMTGMVAGATVVVRTRRRSHEPLVRYDVAVLSGAVATLLVVLVVEPALAADAASAWAPAVALGYTLLVSVLASAVGQEVADGAPTPPGLRLLLTGLVLLTVAGTAYHLQQAVGAYTEWGWIDAASVLAVGLVCAAVLHPSTADTPQPGPGAHPVSRVRVLALTFAAMTPVLLLMWQHLSGRQPDVMLLGGIAGVLFTAVIGRTWHLVGAVQELASLRSERRLDALVRHGADAIVVIDEQGHIRMSSDALSRTWASPSDCSDIASWVHPEDRRAFSAWRQRLATTRRGHRSVSKVRLLKARGEGYAEVVGVNLLHDDEVRGLVLTIRDVSERVALEAQLRRRADRDDLTGLAKRAVFVRVLENRLGTVAAHSPLAVIFIDLDDFKSVNDTLGHAQGDTVLVEAAERLRGNLPEDALAARYGGDEFAAVFDAHGGPARLRAIIDRVDRALQFPVQHAAGEIPMGASIGISIASAATTADVLIREADTAMYAAKRDTTTRVRIFRPSMVAEQAPHD